MMKKYLCLFLVLLFQVNLSADNSKHFKFDPSQGVTEFQATGRPGSFKIKGKSSGPGGTLEIEGTQVTGHFKLELNGFDTGMKLRNEHMKSKYLQTDKYPNAELDFESAPLLKSPLTKGTKIDHETLTGKLTLHGVTKDVHGTYDTRFDGSKLEIISDLEVSIADFGIEKPSFSGVSVDDKVTVHLTSTANLNK